MIKKSITTLAALAGLLLTAGSASAAVIAEYKFGGGAITSSDTEANSTADNFVATGVNLGFSGSGNAFARSQGLVGTNQTDAVDHGAYMSFTVSANEGYELDLTSLTYSSIHNVTYDQSATPIDVSATMNFFVRSSVDDYATNVGDVFTQTWNTGTPNRTITLSGNSAFQDLTGDITFRLYAYESVELDTNQGARWDDVVLNGAVVAVGAVPEPGAYALLAGCLGLTWVMLRRRR